MVRARTGNRMNNIMLRNELYDCGLMVRDRIAAVENREEWQAYTVNLIQKGQTL